MQSFHSIRQSGNGKKYYTALSINMSGSNSTEGSPIMKAPERNGPDVHVLTQEEVIDQMRSHAAPLTKQLEDLLG